MSTDYRIGIVVGLLILIVGVTYFLIQRGDETPPPPVVEETKEKVKLAETPTPTAPTPQSLPSGELSIGLATMPAETRPAGAITPRLAETQPKDSLGVDWRLDEETSPTPASRPGTAEPSGPAIAFQLDDDADEALKEPDPVIKPIVVPDRRVEVGADRTYTVQDGDQGFWMIAEKVYGRGNGKYWTRIRDANPGVDTNALRVGQVLKIPPLAEEQPPVATTPTRTPLIGETTTTPSGRPSGQREYTVTSDDTSGLWGIAVKVYGKGYLWEHIQRANPGVNPTRLRIGAKLVIPPAPEESSTPRPTPGGAEAPTTRTSATDHGATFTEGGRQYYIVKAGDQGYSGIARKVYGDDRYSYLIDRANPGVDSWSLQPGDKLYIPPKPAGGSGPAPSRAAPSEPSPSEPAPPAGDEPYFGR